VGVVDDDSAMAPRPEIIPELRMAAQWLDGAAVRSPSDVVQWMLAMQGQDLPGAKWSVGLRAPGSTLADVDDALNSGQIVRSWPMRGTLHLVAARDIGWMLGLTAQRTLRSLATRHRGLGLDEATAARAGEAAVQLLAGGRCATRAELFAAFAAAGVSPEGQRGVHLLGWLHQSGLLCLGPMRGNDQAVVLLDEWVPDPRVLERDEALGEFVLRYFSSHGPATVRDFTWWTKLTLRDAGVGLALARGRLEELVVDGVSYWMAPGVADRATRGGVWALPGFDEFLLGYTDRSASLAPEHAQAIVPGSNGMFLPTIVVRGRVVGTWRRRKTGKGLTVSPTLFVPVSRRHRSDFEVAISAYGAFLGVPVAVDDAA
jgi:hypothetical protein